MGRQTLDSGTGLVPALYAVGGAFCRSLFRQTMTRVYALHPMSRHVAQMWLWVSGRPSRGRRFRFSSGTDTSWSPVQILSCSSLQTRSPVFRVHSLKLAALQTRFASIIRFVRARYASIAPFVFLFRSTIFSFYSRRFLYHPLQVILLFHPIPSRSSARTLVSVSGGRCHTVDARCSRAFHSKGSIWYSLCTTCLALCRAFSSVCRP